MHLILISMGENKPGHASDYLKSWKNWLGNAGKSFDVLHYGVTEVRSSKWSQRLKQLAFNYVESLGFLFRLLSVFKSASRLLLLDSPCSYPVIPRMVFRLLGRLGLQGRMLAVCHSFPLSGDEFPDPSVRAMAKPHFQLHRLLVHSRAIRHYLINDLQVPAIRIINTNWGCEPVNPARFREKRDRLRILFFGQYRTTKGLEWCWRNLQKLPIPCDFIVRISVSEETGNEVAAIMEKDTASKFHSLFLSHKIHFNHEEIVAGFENVDLLVIPYSKRHCIVSGLVYLAASFGCPVISSHHSESAEIPQANGFGYLFPVEDDAAFLKCLQMYHGEPDKQALRRNALVFAEQNSWSKEIAAEWNAIEASR
jgi:glycosyltransferase involved in cell wall biosynthesis